MSIREIVLPQYGTTSAKYSPPERNLTRLRRSVILNMADKGFKVCAYNRTTSKVDDFLANEAKGKQSENLPDITCA